MNLLQLRDFCRFEAQVKGPDTLNGFINQVINEELQEQTGRLFFQEMLVTHVQLTNPGAGIQSWVLPTDIQHWLPDSIRFSEGGSYSDSRALYQGTFGRINAGPPYRFRRAGGALQLWPYDGVTTLTNIWIDYYKMPATLAADGDAFPIPDIEATVKFKVISRLSRFSSTDRSKAFAAEAQDSFTTDNAQENRANSE